MGNTFPTMPRAAPGTFPLGQRGPGWPSPRSLRAAVPQPAGRWRPQTPSSRAVGGAQRPSCCHSYCFRDPQGNQRVRIGGRVPPAPRGCRPRGQREVALPRPASSLAEAPGSQPLAPGVQSAHRSRNQGRCCLRVRVRTRGGCPPFALNPESVFLPLLLHALPPTPRARALWWLPPPRHQSPGEGPAGGLGGQPPGAAGTPPVQRPATSRDLETKGERVPVGPSPTLPTSRLSHSADSARGRGPGGAVSTDTEGALCPPPTRPPVRPDTVQARGQGGHGVP